MADALGVHRLTVRLSLVNMGIRDIRKVKLEYRKRFILENLETTKGKDIAKQLGITHSKVSSILRSIGVSDRRRNADLENYREYFQTNAKTKTREQMADELKLSPRTVARYLNTLGISTRKTKRQTL
jgi:AraC-like DNA-binding protein